MYFNERIETMGRDDLDALYRKWFIEYGIKPSKVRTHEDLRDLPIISGRTMRENQPPDSADFLFRSIDWNAIFTLHETSGTSGTPKTFFLIVSKADPGALLTGDKRNNEIQYGRN